MFIKGIFKDSPVLIQILIMILVIGIGFIGMSIATMILIILWSDLSPEAFQNLMLNLDVNPDIIRNLQFFQIVTLFIFPALSCAWLFSDRYKTYLQLDTPISFPTAGLATLGIVVSIPFINGVYDLNKQIILPEYLGSVEKWMKALEVTNTQTLEKILYVHSIMDLVINVMIICVLAAVGEEFLFRGLIQNIFSKNIKNPHLVIWIVAILFSTIHLQFYGFIPRVLLGAYLGYLLYYTKNIWIPVLAHFINNLFGVVMITIFQWEHKTTVSIDALGFGPTWWLSIISLALFLVIFRRIRKQYKV